jgi:predicted  nucleic acid-binding Zn-ribbon protein
MQMNVDRFEQDNAELRGQLEAAEESIRRLEEQVLAKQIELDSVSAQLKTLTVPVGILLISVEYI